VNEITVTLKSVVTTDTGINVNICYSTPDGGDWYAILGNLTLGNNQFPAWGGSFMSEIKADRTKKGQRCVAIIYQIPDKSMITTPFVFTLLKIGAVPREIPPCENLQNRLDTNPKIAAYGLQVKCNAANNDGSITAKLLSHSSGTSDADAQKALDDVLCSIQ